MTGLLAILFALSLSETAPGGEGHGGVSEARPPMTVCRAVEVAERYVLNANIDLSGQYVHSVQLQYDAERRERCWRIQWMWTRPALGGEFGLKVYFDGEVREDRLGP
jgi:hypothetical protein